MITYTYHRSRSYSIFIWTVLCCGLSLPLALGSETENTPSVKLVAHSLESIQASVERFKAGDLRTVRAVDLLSKTVNESTMNATPPSVTDKPIVPASGDKHDYMSMSPYWWPDPNTEDGLPYIRIDGKVNPMRDQLDNKAMDKMVAGAWFCAVLYTYTGDERYASKAADFLRVWFLNPETRMNPNLKYSQSRPGWDELRASALLDSQRLLRMIDTSPLILGTAHWSIDDHAALQSWFSEYVDWFHTSEQGVGESKATNNHGSYYDTQLISFAAFAGREELARETLLAYNQKRIVPQLDQDGSQPHELERTRPFHYCNFNITAWVLAAQIGDQLGVDIWEARAEKSIGRALKWLRPYATEVEDWVRPQPIQPRDQAIYRYLIHQSADRYAYLHKDAIVATLPDFDYSAENQLRFILEYELFR